MTFFYNLNKTLDAIRAKPETTHGQLNERDEGKPGKNFEKIAKDAGERYGSKAAGERVAGAVRAKLAKQGKLEEGGLGAAVGAGLGALAAGPVGAAAGGALGHYSERGLEADDADQAKRTQEGFGDTIKTGAQAALQAIGNKLGHGSDEDLIKDLQRKAGVPVTGKVPPQQPGQQPAAGQQPNSVKEQSAPATLKDPSAAAKYDSFMQQRRNDSAAMIANIKEDDMEEGNKFTGNLMKARAAGKKQADLDGDGDMEQVREAAKPDYIDLDKDGNRKESMRKAAADKKKHKHEELEEGWDDMLKDVERRRSATKKGQVTHGAKHDIEDTGTGRRVTRRTDPNTGYSVGADDDKPADGEKRGRGRPKKADRAPERVTANATKHKGGRKMTKEEIDEAITALEEAGYSVKERKLSSSEKSEREDIVKGMKQNKAGFEKRYGKRGEEVMYATATKLAKERGPGNPDRKKKEKTEESGTVAGSVAPAAGSKAKQGGIVGKGIYDSLNRDLEAMIAESMNVSVNMSMDEHGEPRKNITVSAEGEAAEQLAQLLNLAGMAAKDSGHEDCGCGTSPCSCEEELDENQPDWPTNQETTGQDDPEMRRWSGGLNGPKSTGQAVDAPPSLQPQRQGVMGENKDLGMKLYAELKSFKG